MNMRLSIFFIAIVFINASVFAYQAEVENISNSDYFQPALDSINNANQKAQQAQAALAQAIADLNAIAARLGAGLSPPPDLQSGQQRLFSA